MTIRHAQLLDTAFATWQHIVDSFADDRNTDPNWDNHRVIALAAGDLVKSLIPLTYNFPVTDTHTTDLIWKEIVEANEVLTFEAVAEVTNWFYDFKGLAALNGQKFYGASGEPAWWAGVRI